MLNYGLYLLSSVPGKLGKYMDDGRILGDYVLHGHVPRLEVSIYIHTNSGGVLTIKLCIFPAQES